MWRYLALAGLMAVACGGRSVEPPGGSGGSGGTGGSGGSGGAGGSGGTGTGGGPSPTACTRNDDCIVIPESCCGSCGAPTRTDARAANRNHVPVDPKCAMTGCPACYQEPDPTLLATCDHGDCRIVDLRLDPSTACKQDGECRLRSPDCCECGGRTSPLVAISSEPLYSALVCDDRACPECAPIYPTNWVATCDNGHCATAVLL